MGEDVEYMNDWRPDSPICLFIFNRPKKTRRVFETIRTIQPKSLYVIADGPRNGHPEDRQNCRKARSVTETINWSCSVHREYAETNLGLKDRFVTGFETIFSNEKRAIILEDDCVPNRDFFEFCDTMLKEYKNDMRIWDISGTNYLKTWRQQTQDYHFSYYGGVWGWATWRTSWERYDPEMMLWENKNIRNRLRDVIADESQYQYLRTVYDRTYRGDITTWDYPWGFTRHINSGLSIVPAKNLVTNIGFGAGATNTTDRSSDVAGIKSYDMEFPLDFHEYVGVDRKFDSTYHKLRTSWWERQPILRRVTDFCLRHL